MSASSVVPASSTPVSVQSSASSASASDAHAPLDEMCNCPTDGCQHVIRASQAIKAAALGEWAIGATEQSPTLHTGLQDALALLQKRMATILAQRDQVALLDLQTGLLNRLAFRREIEARLSAPAPANKGSALICIDLDDFRRINDRLGYVLGDRILQAVARRLRVASDWLRDSSPASAPPLLSRFGSDEFALYLIESLSPHQIMTFSNTILKIISEPLDLGHISASVTASAGVALVGEHSQNYTTLLEMAELALNEAKAHGANRVKMFEADLLARAQERARLEADMLVALENDQFTFAFQPQMPTHSADQPMAEALIRWKHPERGFIAAASFIPIAEASDLITQIGRWAIDTGIQTIARWARQGIGCRLSINLTARDLCDPGMVEFIQQRLEETTANPDLLEIELTESTFMDDEQDIAAVLHDIRNLGIRIAIDDFGTGYSNLARLLQLPIDRLKIDRSLISRIGSHPHHRAVVQGLIVMARSLGYEVVAEGVETDEHIELLRAMGSCFMQGYGIGRPMSEELLQAWLQRYNLTTSQGLIPDTATFANLVAQA